MLADGVGLDELLDEGLAGGVVAGAVLAVGETEALGETVGLAEPEGLTEALTVGVGAAPAHDHVPSACTSRSTPPAHCTVPPVEAA